jgi:hypothetical protein
MLETAWRRWLLATAGSRRSQCRLTVAQYGGGWSFGRPCFLDVVPYAKDSVCQHNLRQRLVPSRSVNCGSSALMLSLALA